MIKRFEKQLAERRRRKAVNAFINSLTPQPKVETVRKERRYFMAGCSDGGHYPSHINLNRHSCDTFFYTEDGKIVGGDVRCRVGNHYKMGIQFPYWDHEALLSDCIELDYETWKKWKDE